MDRTVLTGIVILAVLFFAIGGAQAEFRAWAPINPAFVGGNALNGQWILNKEQATNEYADDKLEKMMNELMGRIDKLTTSVTERLDHLNLTFEMPVLLQVGSNNSGVIGGSGGSAAPAAPATGQLSGFKPSLGME